MWATLEIALVVIVGVYFFTQIVLPPWIGKKYFWIHRKSERYVMEKERELAELGTVAEALELDRKIKKGKNQLHKTKKGDKK